MRAVLRRGVWIESRGSEIVLPGPDGELRFSGAAGRFMSLLCERLDGSMSVAELRAAAPAHLVERLDEALTLLRSNGLLSCGEPPDVPLIVLGGPAYWRDRAKRSLVTGASSSRSTVTESAVHAVLRGDTAWIGPLGCTETRWSQIECRLPPFTGFSHDFAPPELVAAVLELEVKTRRRGTCPQVVAVHPDGTTSRHNVVPVRSMREDLSREQALRWCTDPVTGVLRGVGETGLFQGFGVATKATAAASGPASAAVLTAVAVADDLATARARACERVLRKHITSDLLLRRTANTVIGVGSDMSEAAAECLSQVSGGPRLSVPAERVRAIVATAPSPLRDFEQLLDADDRSWAVTQLGDEVPVLEFWLDNRVVGRFCTPTPERTVERGVESLLSAAAAGVQRERGRTVIGSAGVAPSWRTCGDPLTVLGNRMNPVESRDEAGSPVWRAAGVSCQVEVCVG
ncbi:hypothetical protein [Lentzea sp. HUAS12]|uniref:hypothetical protein n=1 Tax=Lentzea sp. HUAS12 TaxID=2951806 RepID=UPI0020A001C1|nr:hypothetical protein [Lentzea sp. HUAS12]USX56352.1 hypothetical protein ND450_20295 [Lentzea sp. HUAS12]